MTSTADWIATHLPRLREMQDTLWSAVPTGELYWRTCEAQRAVVDLVLEMERVGRSLGILDERGNLSTEGRERGEQ